MEHQVQQQIERKNSHQQEQIHEQGLEGSDKFDPLRSSQLKKSDFTQFKKVQQQQDNQNNQLHQQQASRLLNIEPYSSRVSLHEQYPALSRQLRQQQGQDIQEPKEPQQVQVQFTEQKHIQHNEHKPHHHETQLKQSTTNLQKPVNKKPDPASQQKFQKYLNEQIGQMLLNDMNGKAKLSQTLQSPILLKKNISQRSVDYSFYDPEKYSLNLSRSYLPNFLSLGNPTVYQQAIEKKLKQIFDYYSETYLQPTKYYDTFDSVKKRTMGFQSFCLFAKDFKFLKTIFSLQTIKKVYKRHSEFGKVLQLQNFINLVQALAHEQESNTYFRLEITVPNMNVQTRQELQTREFYAYLGLHEDMEKIREKFSKIFHPFGCKKDVQLPRLKFNYHKFSQPDLHKKALPQPKQKKKKTLVVLKSNQKFQASPFDQQKSVVVSWQILKSRSAQTLDSIKFSSSKVKKYIKQDPEDKVYLKEYKEPRSLPRVVVEKKISEIQKSQEKAKKPHRVIENLEKMEEKILAAKLKMQKKLNIKSNN